MYNYLKRPCTAFTKRYMAQVSKYTNACNARTVSSELPELLFDPSAVS